MPVVAEAPLKVPVVDLDALRSPDLNEQTAAINTLGDAFRDLGFLAITTDAITQERLDQDYAVTRQVFGLPHATKLGYQNEAIHRERGYSDFESELGIYCRRLGLDYQEVYNDYENWFLGPELNPNDPMLAKYGSLVHPNIWPKEVPEFQPRMQALYKDIRAIGTVVLGGVAQYLNLEPDYFETRMAGGYTTLLRALNYPAVKTQDFERYNLDLTRAEKQDPTLQNKLGSLRTRGCAHTDIDVLAVLPNSTGYGLQELSRDHQTWHNLDIPKGSCVVQWGDIGQHLTGGALLSAIHRVVVPTPKPEQSEIPARLSFAQFFGFDPDVDVTPLSNVLADPRFEGTVKANALRRYPPATAGNLLLARLQEIFQYDPNSRGAY